MSTLDQIELTQPRIAKLTDWAYISSNKIRLMSMVCCALVLRAVVVASTFLSIAAPSRDFGQFGAEMGWVARSLASGHGFSSPFFPATGPTALVPPLFPYLLASVFRVCGLYTAASALVILLLDSLLSALTCIPIYLSLKHAAGERPAQLAGWLWAIYPFAVYFSGTQVWDYALTSFLFATCFCFVQRLHLQDRFSAWFGFGILYGITALSNPSVLSVLPFLLLTALLKVRRVGGRWLLRGIVTVLAFMIVVAPWTIRNYRVMHAASPIRDGFWLEFWAGNDGDTSASNPAGAHPATNAPFRRRFTPPRYPLLDWILELQSNLPSLRTPGCAKCFLLHLHHTLHVSRNMALVGRGPKPRISLPDPDCRLPHHLLLDPCLNGLPSTHRAADCHSRDNRNIRLRGIDWIRGFSRLFRRRKIRLASCTDECTHRCIQERRVRRVNWIARWDRTESQPLRALSSSIRLSGRWRGSWRQRTPLADQAPEQDL